MWAVKMPRNASWSWRKLLKLRDLAVHHVRWKVGTGSSISFWYDNWSGLGPLVTFCQRGCLCFPSLGPTATVAHTLKDGSWRWHRSNDITQAEEITFCVSTHLQIASWSWLYPLEEHTQILNYTSPRWLKTDQAKGVLAPCFWFHGHIPRTSFVVWLAITDKLPTPRIESEIGQVSPTCHAHSVMGKTNRETTYSSLATPQPQYGAFCSASYNLFEDQSAGEGNFDSYNNGSGAPWTPLSIACFGQRTSTPFGLRGTVGYSKVSKRRSIKW